MVFGWCSRAKFQLKNCQFLLNGKSFPMMEKNTKFFQEISENISDKSTKIIFYVDLGHDLDQLLRVPNDSGF